MNVTSAPPRDDRTISPSQDELASRDDEAVWLAERFKTLADPQRLKILHLLMTRSAMCVCEIIEVLGLTQSNTSFHLNTLKHVRFITSQKVGKWIFYSLDRREMEQFNRMYADTFDFAKWPELPEVYCCDTRVCDAMEEQNP